MKYFWLLLATERTVWDIHSLQHIVWINNVQVVRNLVTRWQKAWLIKRIARWIRGLPNWKIQELSSSLMHGSYISCETVLWKHGIIFQTYDTTTTCIAKQSKTYTLWNNTILYRKIKDTVLTNPLGIVHYPWRSEAQPERALCDMVYLFPSIGFDNLHWINRNLVWEIAQIYHNKRVLLSCKQLFDAYNTTA